MSNHLIFYVWSISFFRNGTWTVDKTLHFHTIYTCILKTKDSNVSSLYWTPVKKGLRKLNTKRTRSIPVIVLIAFFLGSYRCYYVKTRHFIMYYRIFYWKDMNMRVRILNAIYKMNGNQASNHDWTYMDSVFIECLFSVAKAQPTKCREITTRSFKRWLAINNKGK